ncbi:hypothetical protein CBR_g25900 [Chara braunii]|uniref:CCHC-type domain-containing protein n=1 Tax=Chara braunii TaxID=69332 RepID=A0A388L6P0_CHABU|nr:hypothetical protein CBR_g25900 [Chara braunii]|eukprot:GBG77969.1 hypothetical protein CBR_g25900 [Chara braunii]
MRKTNHMARDCWSRRGRGYTQPQQDDEVRTFVRELMKEKEEEREKRQREEQQRLKEEEERRRELDLARRTEEMRMILEANIAEKWREQKRAAEEQAETGKSTISFKTKEGNRTSLLNWLEEKYANQDAERTVIFIDGQTWADKWRDIRSKFGQTTIQVNGKRTKLGQAKQLCEVGGQFSFGKIVRTLTTTEKNKVALQKLLRQPRAVGSLVRLPTMKLVGMYMTACLFGKKTTRNLLKTKIDRVIKQTTKVSVRRKVTVKFRYDSSVLRSEVGRATELVIDQKVSDQAFAGFVKRKVRIISTKNRTVGGVMHNHRRYAYTEPVDCPCAGYDLEKHEGHVLTRMSRLKFDGLVLTPIDRNAGDTALICPVLYRHGYDTMFTWNEDYSNVEGAEEEVIARSESVLRKLLSAGALSSIDPSFASEVFELPARRSLEELPKSCLIGDSRIPHKYDTRAKRKAMETSNTTQYDMNITPKVGAEHSKRSKKSENDERSVNHGSEHPRDDHPVLREVERERSQENTLDYAEKMVVEGSGDNCRVDGDGSCREDERKSVVSRAAHYPLKWDEVVEMVRELPSVSNRKWSLEQMKAITSAREGNVEAAKGGNLKAEEIFGLLVKLGSFEKLTLPAPATQALVGAEEGKVEKKKEKQKEESESEGESSDDDARRRRKERQKKKRDRDWKKDNKSRDWQRRDDPFRCYYCDEEGHTITRCPLLEKELEEGIVMKNVNGHVRDANWNKIDFRVKGGMRAVVLEQARANKDKKKKARVNVIAFDNMLPPEIVARDDNPGSQSLNVSHISQKEVEEKKREKAQRELHQLIDGTKDLVKEEKGKEAAGKKRRVVLRSEAEEGISIDEVVKKLLEETEITLSWKEAVALVPKIIEELKKMVERRKVEINSLRLFPQHVERAPSGTKMRFGNMSCGYLNITVNDVKVRALVDSGAEMVLMSSATMRSCGIGIDRKVNHQLSNIAGFLPLEGFIDDLPIRIGTLRAEILCFVVPNLDQDCIFGAPSHELAESSRMAERRMNEIEDEPDDQKQDKDAEERFKKDEYDGEYKRIGMVMSSNQLDEFYHEKIKRTFRLRRGHLFVDAKEGLPPLRVVCGKERQLEVIAVLHEGLAAGHRVADATYYKVSRLYHWDGLRDMVMRYCGRYLWQLRYVWEIQAAMEEEERQRFEEEEDRERDTEAEKYLQKERQNPRELEEEAAREREMAQSLSPSEVEQPRNNSRDFALQHGEKRGEAGRSGEKRGEAGRSREKRGEVDKSWEKWREAGRSGEKRGEVGRSGQKWEKEE